MAEVFGTVEAGITGPNGGDLSQAEGVLFAGRCLRRPIDLMARGTILFSFPRMRKTRTIVAVTLLATALCADRAVASAAAQAARVEAEPVARGFAQRLTVSLRRTVPAVRMLPGRLEGVGQVVRIGGGIEKAQQQGGVHGVEGVPFQFRLPPPAR